MRLLDRVAARWALVSLAGAAAVAVVDASIQQQPVRELISVDEPRPLAAVVLALQERFGVAISYEDPQYNRATQAVDVSESVRKDRGLKGIRSFFPRGGPFSFEYPAKSGWNFEQLGRLLTRLLQEYESTDYAHCFELRKSEGMYHVIPVCRRDDNGVDQDYEAILSAEVALPRRGEERCAYYALMDLAESVRSATGADVGIGSVPTNLLMQTLVTDPPAHSSARMELLRILRSAGRPLSWRLLHSPNDQGSFALNIRAVTNDAPSTM